MSGKSEEGGAPGLPLVGPAPWDDDVEAWLEVSSSEEIAECIHIYAANEVKTASRQAAIEIERLRKILRLAESELRMQGCDDPYDQHAHAVWRACCDALTPNPN